MLTLTKFVCGCFGFGALVVLGMTLLQAPTTGQKANAHGDLSVGDSPFIQTTLAEAGSVYSEASSEISPSLKSFAAASGAYVRSNATTARLQLEGMENGLASHSSIEAWLPDSASSWLHGGIPMVSQTTKMQANALADKNLVFRACKADIERLTNVSPSLNAAWARF